MSAILREGDIITVAGQVICSPMNFDGVDKVKVRIEPYHDIFVPASDVTIVRANFHVGDLVDWTAGDMIHQGEILAVAGDHLWVSMGGGQHATVWAANARRVDLSADDAEVDQ